jgi:Rrf2 family protein
VEGLKISTRGRYGLRALVDVAAYGADKCVSIRSIADRNGLSEHYLEQLLPLLKTAGFVKSLRGAQGGYTLSRPASEISVGDILRALEGPMSVGCVSEEAAPCAASCTRCVAKPVWEKIYQRLHDVMESISLAELAQEYLSGG